MSLKTFALALATLPLFVSAAFAVDRHDYEISIEKLTNNKIVETQQFFLNTQGETISEYINQRSIYYIKTCNLPKLPNAQTTDEVTTGTSLAIKTVNSSDRNEVETRIDFEFSELIAMTLFSSGDCTIQLPETTNKSGRSTLSLKPGMKTMMSSFGAVATRDNPSKEFRVFLTRIN